MRDIEKQWMWQCCQKQVVRSDEPRCIFNVLTVMVKVKLLWIPGSCSGRNAAGPRAMAAMAVMAVGNVAAGSE